VQAEEYFPKIRKGLIFCILNPWAIYPTPKKISINRNDLVDVELSISLTVLRYFVGKKIVIG